MESTPLEKMWLAEESIHYRVEKSESAKLRVVDVYEWIPPSLTITRIREDGTTEETEENLPKAVGDFIRHRPVVTLGHFNRPDHGFKCNVTVFDRRALDVTHWKSRSIAEMRQLILDCRDPAAVDGILQYLLWDRGPRCGCNRRLSADAPDVRCIKCGALLCHVCQRENDLEICNGCFTLFAEDCEDGDDIESFDDEE